MKSIKKIHKKDIFNARFVQNAKFSGVFEFPSLEKPKKIIIPKDTIPFSCRGQTKDFSEFIQFYEHDFRFSDFLINPESYISELKNFPGIITPDCSLYRNMPLNIQIYNTYVNRALGSYLQTQGFYVIPNVRWGDERSYSTCMFSEKFAFSGLPKQSILSVGTYGCIQGKENKYYFREGLRMMLDELNPHIVLVYGSMPADVFHGLHKKTKFIQYMDWISKKKRRYNHGNRN